MSETKNKFQFIVVLIATAWVTSGFASGENTAQTITSGGEIEALKVTSRNVYVGANIFRVLEQTDPLEILAEIAAVYQTTQETNFPARAEVLADEILVNQPHVVGLQEVALVRRQSPGDVLQGNPIAATEVETDYLQLLLDALTARGLDYVVAASIDNADIELPLFGLSLDDIRLTDRDVLLVRADVPFVQSEAANYADNVVIDLAGTLIDFNRGYTAASVTVGGMVYRVVNTHLEVGSQSAIQAAQAEELVSMLASESLPTILLGDFNASIADPPGGTYSLLTNAGFTDLWTVRSTDEADPGYTCCHGETLLDPLSVFTSRIDLVLARFGSEITTTLVAAAVIGDNLELRTPEGLWPSDHGGIKVELGVVNKAPDTDGDAVKDNVDNCQLISNSTQQDTDADGYGNACDADFDQSGLVDFQDLVIFADLFGSDNSLADLNGDAAVNFLDLSIMRDLFLAAAGPSALN